jgi:serine/threonine protein kinase
MKQLMESKSEVTMIKSSGKPANKIKMTIKDFDIQGVLGEGSYGKVYCGILKADKKAFAIKILDKFHIRKVTSLCCIFRTKKLKMFSGRETCFEMWCIPT